ncbi:putative GTPase [Naematelia encephala]|uniref:Putative GTPase n=1 Tax=Naematelia encephala TaxID=71784 RepID=A0A1Y2AXS2_9TREE|nr:putative GTPase [Naematelia encephala]
MDPMTWDYILKYVIVGDSAVGKSSLLVRLTDDRFGDTEPTLGVEFGSRILQVGEDGRKVKVQCWDTAGTESFRSITRSYFRGAAGALLVYDVTRRDSFEHVTSWLDDLRAHADENVSVILVANKTDLCYITPPPLPDIQYGQAVPMPRSSDLADDTSPVNGSSSQSPTTGSDPPASKDPNLKPRAVSTLEGALFAKQHGLLYVETSAKEGWGVVDAFEWTAREVLRRVQKSELDKRRPGGVKLDERQAKKGGCC